MGKIMSFPIIHEAEVVGKIEVDEDILAYFAPDQHSLYKELTEEDAAGMTGQSWVDDQITQNATDWLVQLFATVVDKYAGKPLKNFGCTSLFVEPTTTNFRCRSNKAYKQDIILGQVEEA